MAGNATSKTKETSTTSTTGTTINVCVVGFRFRGCSPKDMDEGVFRFDYEPTNKFDKNAVKVMKLIDNDKLIHIGYLSRNTALDYANFNPQKLRSVSVVRFATTNASVMLRLTAS